MSIIVDGFSASKLFSDLADQLGENPNLVKEFNSILEFSLTSKGKSESWTLDLKNGKGSISRGKGSVKPDCTLIMTDENCVGVMSGTKDGSELFFSGDLKIKGDMSVAMKLGNLKVQKKSPSSSSASVTVPGFKSAEVFEKMQQELAKNPALGKDIGGVIEFALTNKSGTQQSWTINLKDKIGVTLGKPATKGDCTLLMKDEDCFSIMTGGQDATELFMSGGLKIKGDMSFAMKLGSLKVSVEKSPANANGLSVAGYKTSQIFIELAQGIKDHPELVKEIGAVYEFQVKGKDGIQAWTLDLKKGQVLLGKSPEKADCTLTMSDDDCFNVMSGTLDATELFMSGGLKIKGDMSLAMKLGTIRDKRAKAPAKTSSSASAPSVAVDGFKSSTIFTEIAANIKPELVKDINAVYEFSLTNSKKTQQSWVVDCKKGLVSVGKPTEKPDVTLIMKDEDCLAIMSGAKDSTELFMEGGLKIKGDMSLAMKLGSLKDAIPKAKL